MIANNRKGNALLSVILAAAVGVVISMAMITMINNMQSAGNNARFRAEADALHEEIRFLLSSPEACGRTFNGLSTTGTHDIAVIRQSDGTARYRKGVGYGDRTLTLTSMTLSGFRVGSAPDRGVMELVLSFNSDKDTSGANLLSRRINIGLEKTAANAIRSCVALAKMTDGIWQRSPSNDDDTFFAGTTAAGRVGIGKTNPQHALDVNGTISASGNLLAGGNIESEGNVAVKGDVSVDRDINVGRNIEVDGDVGAKGDIAARVFLYSSDARLKTDIRPIAGEDLVARLSGVRFRWKDDLKRDIGFIAQDVERVVPELVVTGVDGMKSVKYAHITALLVEAVKEQRKAIRELSAEVDRLSARLREAEASSAKR